MGVGAPSGFSGSMVAERAVHPLTTRNGQGCEVAVQRGNQTVKSSS